MEDANTQTSSFSSTSSPPFHGSPVAPSTPCLKPGLPMPDSSDMDPKLLRFSFEKNSARSSFSSVRENDAALIQSFTSTKVSSYAAAEAIQDDLDLALEEQPEHQQQQQQLSPSSPTQSPINGQSMATATQTQFVPPRTQPQSRLHGSWLPAVVAADNFQGWKQIGVKGRQASRSFGDLRSLSLVWSTPEPPVQKTQAPRRAIPGQSPIERLPTEILGAIVDLLVLDVPPNGITARNIDLRSLLLTSRALHGAALNSLYKNITVPHSKIFRKFLAHVSQNPELGTIVRRIDFSHFNPTSLFSTASERAATQDLTRETLLRCLELTPYLQEFLAQEYIDEEIDVQVLRKLFFGMPRLKAIDLCACSSAKFKDTWQTMTTIEWPDILEISRLSLHRCTNLPVRAFELLMPRLVNLTHLDVTGTNITDEALQSIPHTARITHLNLAKCKRLTADFLVQFLATHPAVKHSLVYLSLATDARSHQLLTIEDVTKILPVMPATLRSLSLKGSKMEPSHIDLLRPLARHLEELSVGRGLKISDLERLLLPDEVMNEHATTSIPNPQVSSQNESQTEDESNIPHTLKFLDMSDYPASEVDMNALYRLLKPRTAPLDVIEITETLYTRLAKLSSVQRAGWDSLDFGSRAWLVRRFIPDETSSVTTMMMMKSPVKASDVVISSRSDSGARGWKMGASFWGMRKVPVATMEVGGMYGMYMFKRTL